MTDDQKLQKLISFLESNNIVVKSDRGNFEGGLVRYHDEKFIYLNRKLDTEARIKLILKEIVDLDLDYKDYDDILSFLKENN